MRESVGLARRRTPQTTHTHTRRNPRTRRNPHTRARTHALVCGSLRGMFHSHMRARRVGRRKRARREKDKKKKYVKIVYYRDRRRGRQSDPLARSVATPGRPSVFAFLSAGHVRVRAGVERETRPGGWFFPEKNRSPLRPQQPPCVSWSTRSCAPSTACSPERRRRLRARPGPP